MGCWMYELCNAAVQGARGGDAGGEHYGQENTDVGEHTIKIQMSEMRCSDVKRTKKEVVTSQQQPMSL